MCKGSTSAFDAESTGSNPVRAGSLVLGIVPAGMRFLVVYLQCILAEDNGELGLNSFASVLDIYVKMKDVHSTLHSAKIVVVVQCS